MNEQVKALIERKAEQMFNFHHPAYIWEQTNEGVKSKYRQMAKYFLSDPDLAMITKCERCDGQGVFHTPGYEYGEDKPIECSQCHGTGIIPIPLSELKEVE